VPCLWITQDLSHNSITEVPQSFKYLVLLEELYLGNNKLHEIPAVLFQTARQLKVLDLSTNYIASLPDLFGNLRLLKTLLLSYNKINSGGFSLSLFISLSMYLCICVFVYQCVYESVCLCLFLSGL
jgi:Leucine-rich repeat (LRR) protein